MKINNLTDIESFHNIFEEDSNKRDIKSYILKDCQFTKSKVFYPDVVLYSHKTKNAYNPINEIILSLDKVSVIKKNNFEINEINFLKETPMFYFIYNTENYYHFIYDSLPYLITYNEIKKTVPNIKLLMNYPNKETKNIYNFVFEFLELLNIKKEDITFVSDETIYSVVFISSSYTHGNDSNLPPRKEVYDFFTKLVESNFDKFNSNTPKKIYISRRSWIHNDYTNIGTNYTLKRKMENENELVGMLENHGYKEIFTEKLNTIEKLNLFYNAENIIGAIGGGLCNVLFSKPKTKIITIVSPTFLEVNNRFKYSLDCVNNEYFYETKHTESTDFKTNLRVQHNNKNLIGEISKINGDILTIIYSDDMIAGWNNEVKYKKIEVESKSCTKLDYGLNSPFNVDLKKIKDLIFLG